MSAELLKLKIKEAKLIIKALSLKENNLKMSSNTFVFDQRLFLKNRLYTILTELNG